MEIAVGDLFRMRRKHPCGSFDFRVYRTGADIGIECTGCGRRVLLDRQKFESRAKSRLEPAP